VEPESATLIIGTEVEVISFSEKNFDSERISAPDVRLDFFSFSSSDIILVN